MRRIELNTTGEKEQGVDQKQKEEDAKVQNGSRKSSLGRSGTEIAGWRRELELKQGDTEGGRRLELKEKKKRMRDCWSRR